jgi:signal transduction histidine kinase
MVIPVSLGFAMLRFRLWEVDRLVRRTIFYAFLTAAVVSVYIAVVVAISIVLPFSGLTIASATASGLIAVSFQPLRMRLQAWVNKRLYGFRDEPGTVLQQLGLQLEAAMDPSSMLAAIAETVRTSMRVPYVAISGFRGEARAVLASSGMSRPDLEVWPLTYQGQIVGDFLISPRSPDEPLGSRDRTLLAAIARQTGIAVHATRVSNDLADAYQQLVSTRDEERQRLRRDLHDGLGPQLASQTLTLDAALVTLEHNPSEAHRMLADLRGHLQDSIDEIRRVIYALGPTGFGENGLAGSIQESFRLYHFAHVHFSLIVTDKLPPLSVHTETEIYRIVLEAITNVVRHASATEAVVTIGLLEERGRLILAIEDNGSGLPIPNRPGFGLESMRTRTERLNGTLRIESNSGGTRVYAELPVFPR